MSNNGLFLPSSKPYGSAYDDWTAKWWQWAYSIPKERNPITDTSGVNCAEGQKGPVWFLAGTTGGPAERTRKIPAGKAVLFPVIAGSHTIHFSGVSTTYAATGVNTYSTEVTYHLTVR